MKCAYLVTTQEHHTRPLLNCVTPQMLVLYLGINQLREELGKHKLPYSHGVHLLLKEDKVWW